MVNYQAEHSSSKERLMEFLLPSPLVGTLYFLVSTLELVFINIHSVWQFAFNHILGTPQEAGVADYSIVTNPVFSFLGKLNTPLLLIFWGAIGALVYGLIYTVQKVVSVAEEEVKESQYLEGGVLPGKNYWHSEMRANLIFILILISWFSYLMVYFQLLMPWLSKVLITGLYNSVLWKSALEILGVLVGNTLALFGLLLVGRLLLESWHSIRP